MKTFFNITISGLGDEFTTRVQSTKLRKVDEYALCGIYAMRNNIVIDNYLVELKLMLSYSIEIGGTVGKVIKQRRYTLHGICYDIYSTDTNGMWHNQPKSLADISVDMEEVDVQPCTCTISVSNK